jgi:hypothetical protein
MRRRGQPSAACIAAALLCVVNPFTLQAVRLGEPEVLFGAAACVGALLAALRGRDLPAAMLLGLSLATAQFAVIAALPLVAALAARRARARIVAVCVALIAGTIATVPGEAGWAAPALALTWLWWSMRRRNPDDVLGLLALLFMLRILLDPSLALYVYTPFLLSLVAWEGMTRRGVPVVSLLFVAAIASAAGAGGGRELYVLASLPVGVWLTVRLYAPSLRWGRRAWPLPVRPGPDAIA